MNIEDLLLPPDRAKTEKWQLGNYCSENIEEGGIVLIFCSDFRGAENGEAHNLDYSKLREELYQLSNLDFQISLCDLGDLISGKSHADTHFIVQELITHCLQKKTLPIWVGGSADLAYPLFSAVNSQYANINYTQISNQISLADVSQTISEKNFLSKIFAAKEFTLKNYHHLGYQLHLNSAQTVQLLREVDFDMLRLADLMNTTEKAEPFLRRAHLVTLNCNAVESFADAFSTSPQVNGLSRREVCAYMKEIGLSENLKAVGVFNFNAHSNSLLNQQLLAQMLWYLIEGINIQKTHPTARSFETFWVLIDDAQYAFRRDTFSNLWFFGSSENPEELIPCGKWEYEQAKRGELNPRFLR